MIEIGAMSRPADTELPLGRSFTNNVLGVAWTAGVQLAFTPFFIRRVGVEGYGLIGLYVTLQALLQVFDFGFAPTINRWLSRFTASHAEPQSVRDFAKTLEIGSWTIAISVAILLMASAGIGARLWLRDTTFGIAALRASLMLMACTMMAQLPTTYYQSGLLGLRRPLEMNVLKALAATASTAGAALILHHFSSTVQAYFAVQAVVAVLHALALRRLFWRSLPPSSDRPAGFRSNVLRTVWRFTAGMTAIAICAAIVGQVDRIILIRIVSLESFGYYAVASVVASGLAVVSMPAMNTLFPRFSALFSIGDRTRLRVGYHRGAQVTAVLLLPLASVVALFSFPILAAWTGNYAIARNAAPIAMMLTVGTALNGLMYSVYALQLAAGATRLALALTIAQIVIIIPLVIVLSSRYGVIGAASAWSLMNALYFAVGSFATFGQLLPGAWRDWILRDVGSPLAGAVIPAVLARVLIPIPSSRIGAVLVLAAVLVCSLSASALATTTTRERIFALARRGRRADADAR
jgi:O-antigen/teichoic acid export membrane protein